MDSTSFFEDRRQSARYEVTIPATAEIFGTSGLTAFTFERAMIRNVSREGMMLSSESDKPPQAVMLSDVLARGRPCRVSCKIPGSHRTTVFSGTIRWAGCYRSPNRLEYRIGSRLEGNEPDAMGPLSELVTALEPEESDEL